MTGSDKMQPCLHRHAALKRRAEGDVLVLPERALRLSGSGGEILRLCDGERTQAQIVAILCSRYGGDSHDDLRGDSRDYLRGGSRGEADENGSGSGGTDGNGGGTVAEIEAEVRRFLAEMLELGGVEASRAASDRQGTT